MEEERKMKKDLGIAAGRLQIMLKKTQALLESERKTSNALRAELGKEPEVSPLFIIYLPSHHRLSQHPQNDTSRLPARLLNKSLTFPKFVVNILEEDDL